MKKSRILLVASTSALLLSFGAAFAAPGGRSAQTTTPGKGGDTELNVSFEDNCRSYTATSTDRAISHIDEVLFVGGERTLKDEFADVKIFEFSNTAPEGDYFTSVTVKAGLAEETFPCTPPQCDDLVDNDADGDTDHPADAGCTDENDTDESDDPVGPTPGNCDDTVDTESNDGDGFVNDDDPDCQGEECVVDGVNTCNETTDDDPVGPTPGDCDDTVDLESNDGDEFINDDDPDCQGDECLVDGVNTCDEDNDDTPVEPGDPCSADGGDPGLTGEGTVGQQVWNAVGQQIVDTAPGFGLKKSVEDPESDGQVTGPVYQFGKSKPTGSPLDDVVEDGATEGGCAGDLVLEPDGNIADGNDI